ERAQDRALRSDIVDALHVDQLTLVWVADNERHVQREGLAPRVIDARKNGDVVLAPTHRWHAALDLELGRRVGARLRSPLRPGSELLQTGEAALLVNHEREHQTDSQAPGDEIRRRSLLC